MIDQGLLKRTFYGDLRDIIGRRFDEGGVITVDITDTLVTAFNRMRGAQISQLPVIHEEKVVGIIDESDLLLKVATDANLFRSPVGDTMTSQIETLPPGGGLEQLRSTLNRGLVAIIADQNNFYGLITRSDFLNHLRRTLS
jgi:cystathionine beta-synthase